MNAGVLIMAAYIFFVYPQQKEFDQLGFSKIDVTKFKITMEDNDISVPKTFCRRLRNLISHAKFEVIHDNHQIKFKDENNGANKIEFEIDTVSFGEFIDNSVLEVNHQKNPKIS